MKLMWIVFAAGVIASAFLLSGLGQRLLTILMISIIGLPLAIPLMFVPAPTVTYGFFLVTYTVLVRVPVLRRTHRATAEPPASGISTPSCSCSTFLTGMG